jgi:hypothetical protein
MTKTAISLRITLVLSLIGAATAVFVLPGAVTAAAADTTTQGYQISPPVTTLALDPGTSTKQKVKVTNLTDQQMTLQVGKQNFVAKGEEGEVELVDDANPLYSLAPYFSISQPTVTVPPKGTAEVSYTLSVPANAEPGGRYGSITFNTIATKLPSGQSGASVRQELAALVFLRINGAANEKLSIATFKTDKSFYEYGPVNFTARVKNEGNVHEKPTGEIVVKNMLGLKAATVKIDEKNVIPGAIRKLNANLNKKMLFGNYTATLTLRNGDKQTLTATTSFLAVPYKMVTLILILILVVGVPLWRGRKRWAKAFRILAGKE